VHEELLPAIGNKSGLFTEASVPQADKSAAALEDTHGFADLYKAKTTVGIEFPASQKPRALLSHRQLRFQGDKFPHVTKAAPRVRERGPGEKPEITDLKRAPPEIAIGDLKGGMDSIEAADAPEQLDNYLKGFGIVADELNEYGRTNPGLVAPNASGTREWHPTRRTLRKNEVKIPDYYKPGKATHQASERLVLVDNAGRADMDFSKRHRVLGKLYVFADPEREGVWVYVWAPDQEVPLDDLPEDVQRLGTEVASRLRMPLLKAPLARRVRERIARVRARVARRAAEKEEPVEDPFSYTKWASDHKELSDRAATAENEPGWLDAEAATKIDEANATASKYGLKVPKVSGEKLKGNQSVKQIKLWTGNSGWLLGNFRRVFGTAFTAVANLYVRIRDQIRKLLHPSGDKSKSFGGGFGGAALKAAYSVVKGAARYIVSKTAERLRLSLVEGTKKKLKELIGADRVEEIEEALEDVAGVTAQLKSGFVGKLTGLFEPVIEKYQAVVGEIERIKEIVGDALDIVNKVKWGARVIACLSPPGLGCLWILAQSVIEKAAAKVVETCWFKRTIAPLITGLDFVKKLPGRLAGGILDLVRPLLPKPLEDMFEKVDTDPVPVGEDDIGCDTKDDPDSDALTAERRAMFDLIESVGEERFDALLDALMAAGVRFDKRLSVTEIYRVKKIILDSRVTAEQLRKFAKAYVDDPEQRQFGALADFLKTLAKSDPTAIDSFGDPAGESEGGGTDTDDTGGGSGTAIEGVPITGAPQGTHRDYKLVSLGKLDGSLPKGARVTTDVTVSVDGQQVVLRDVRLVVTGREPLSGGRVKLTLGMVREMVFALGRGQPGDKPHTLSLSKTSAFWRIFGGKPTPAKGPQPATSPPAAIEPEPAAAG